MGYARDNYKYGRDYQRRQHENPRAKAGERRNYLRFNEHSENLKCCTGMRFKHVDVEGTGNGLWAGGNNPKYSCDESSWASSRSHMALLIMGQYDSTYGESSSPILSSFSVPINLVRKKGGGGPSDVAIHDGTDGLMTFFAGCTRTFGDKHSRLTDARVSWVTDGSQFEEF